MSCQILHLIFTFVFHAIIPDSMRFYECDYLLFSFKIFFLIPDISKNYLDISIFDIIIIHLISVTDECLIIPYVRSISKWENTIQKHLKILQKGRKIDRKFIRMKWNFYEFLFDAFEIEFFFSDNICEKSMGRNLIEFSGVFTMTITTDKTDRKNSNENNLTLNLCIFSRIDSNHRSDWKLRNYEKECDNRKNRIFESENHGSCCDREETRTSRSMCGYDEDSKNSDDKCSDEVEKLTFTIVFEIEFRMLRICRIIILRIDRRLEAFFEISEKNLYDKSSNEYDDSEVLISKECDDAFDNNFSVHGKNNQECKIIILTLFENVYECFGRNAHLSELSHFLLSFFLFFENFSLTADISSVEFCSHVFSES